jgi:tetratricopeptide (TPR) repeat protein
VHHENDYSRRSAWTLACVHLVAVLAVCWPWRAGAHAELILQIEMVTKEIAQDPRNAELYIRRGQLRREHVEYDAAYADFEQALALEPDLPAIDFLRGRLYLDWGWPLSARACLDRFLARHPKHAEGFTWRARALVRLDQRLAATSDYDQAIALSPEAGPDLFVERAQMLMAEGPEHFGAVLRGLDEGIKRLGPLVTLQLFAIDAELKQGNFDGALARVDSIAARSPRKETWLARRGEILRQAGRPAEAKRAYVDALAALRTLPPTRRNVPAMQELARRIQAEIDSLGGAGPDTNALSSKP